MSVLVSLDLETGGLLADRHAILTIGAVAYQTATDQVLGEIELLVQPEDKEVDPEALAVNGIDLENHMAVAVRRDDAARALGDFVKPEYGRARILGYNVNSFDIPFLRPMLGESLFKRKFQYRALDVYDLVMWANHFKIVQTGGAKLQQLAAHYDVNPGTAHSALSDARTCLAVYKKLRGVLAKNVA